MTHNRIDRRHQRTEVVDIQVTVIVIVVVNVISDTIAIRVRHISRINVDHAVWLARADRHHGRGVLDALAGGTVVTITSRRIGGLNRHGLITTLILDEDLAL